MIMLAIRQRFNRGFSTSSSQQRILNAGKFEKSSSKRNLLWAFPLVTFGLGCWQIQRLQWKLSLIKDISLSMRNEPASVISSLKGFDWFDDGAISPEKSSNEYQRVKIKGEFMHDHEMFLGPRGKSDVGNDKGGGVFSSGGSTGYYVITPFKLDSPGKEEVILVNRGWIPKETKNDPKLLKRRQVKGVVLVDGIIRSGEKV